VIAIIYQYDYCVGLNTEGLFRKSGNCKRLKLLREALSCETDFARVLAAGPFNAHDCASLLKSFLSELPEPLLSEQHFSAHILAAGMAHFVITRAVQQHCNVSVAVGT